MKQTSEFVTIGHPDRVCDYIASFLLDRHLERDPKTRFAVEVQMKDNYVTLGGEVTSSAKFTKGEWERFVREAVAEVGYDAAYAKKWGADNVPCAETLAITKHISEQSPDIACGVDREGWGDQGIFWGMAVKSPSTDDMPIDHYYARRIGERIMAEKLGGIDIKTQVEVDDGRVTSVILAVPCYKRDLPDLELDAACLVRKVIGRKPPHLIVNGTGAYVRHGSMGDCGTTGRKLVVDFYGGNCRIGGGSPWTKDPTKADLTLNIYARMKAREALYKYGLDCCYCAISCCIGRKEISVAVFDGSNRQIAQWEESRPASEIISELGLDKPVYAAKCRNGLFS